MTINKIALQNSFAMQSVLAWFGESVTFLPCGGTPRTITAELDRSRQPLESENSHGFIELLRVSVLKDESDANYGGIGTIDVRDAIRIDGETDQRPYTFTGDIIEDQAHHWELLFRRVTKTRLGGNVSER